NGLNVATLMLCASFIEHKLFDSLKKKNIVKDSPTFASSINLARENKLFPEDLLDRTDRIRELRNPFAHKKPDGHSHSLGTRFLSQKLHPQTIIEADAALAIESMLEYFSLTLIRVK
ncbi:MAG TPA: hypothetical protein VFI26_05985, partial [Lysobacter sp.]|nr:hypothetical protein [Lysobacter sp.]